MVAKQAPSQHSECWHLLHLTVNHLSSISVLLRWNYWIHWCTEETRMGPDFQPTNLPEREAHILHVYINVLSRPMPHSLTQCIFSLSEKTCACLLLGLGSFRFLCFSKDIDGYGAGVSSLWGASLFWTLRKLITKPNYCNGHRLTVPIDHKGQRIHLGLCYLL